MWVRIQQFHKKVTFGGCTSYPDREKSMKKGQGHLIHQGQGQSNAALIDDPPEYFFSDNQNPNLATRSIRNPGILKKKSKLVTVFKIKSKHSGQSKSLMAGNDVPDITPRRFQYKHLPEYHDLAYPQKPIGIAETVGKYTGIDLGNLHLNTPDQDHLDSANDHCTRPPGMAMAASRGGAYIHLDSKDLGHLESPSESCTYPPRMAVAGSRGVRYLHLDSPDLDHLDTFNGHCQHPPGMAVAASRGVGYLHLDSPDLGHLDTFNGHCQHPPGMAVAASRGVRYLHLDFPDLGHLDTFNGHCQHPPGMAVAASRGLLKIL